MSWVRPLAGIATAFLGYKFLVGDQANFHRAYANLKETQMVEEDHLSEALEHMGDGGSGHDTLNTWNHWLFNKSNFHFIRRPLIHLRQFGSMLWDNMIPLGLMGIGLTYGFNLSIGGVLSTAFRGLSGLFSGVRLVGGQIFGAMGELIRGAWPGLRPLLRLPNVGGAKGIMALTALGALGLYTLHKFKRVVTGEEQEERLNYLHSPYYNNNNPGAH